MITEGGLARDRAEPLTHGAIARCWALAVALVEGCAGSGRRALLRAAQAAAMLLPCSAGCVGQPPLLPDHPGTTGTETAGTTGSTATAGGEVEDVGEVGEVDSSVGMTSVGTTPVDPCEGVMCTDDEQCVGGECFACPEPCGGGCEAGELCQCPQDDPCCMGGVCIGPTCDPLLQDCAAEEACYPVEREWRCVADASGTAGAYGDPCKFANACNPGLVCANEFFVPGCDGAAGCCTELCDLSDPVGDAQCMGAGRGQVCQAWYSDGRAPAGYEDIGVCVLP